MNAYNLGFQRDLHHMPTSSKMALFTVLLLANAILPHPMPLEDLCRSNSPVDSMLLPKKGIHTKAPTESPFLLSSSASLSGPDDFSSNGGGCELLPVGNDVVTVYC